MDADSSDMECRVCRSGPEDGRPLYNPCMCSGSIGAVHQDCLEAWLNHSKKDTCELCFSKYQFEPHYAEDTPQIIPFGVLVKSIVKLSIFQAIPFAVRIVLAVLIWVFVVPLVSAYFFCVCVGRHNVMSIYTYSWELLRLYIIHGFCIDAVITMSLLILVRFFCFHFIPLYNLSFLFLVATYLPSLYS